VGVRQPSSTSPRCGGKPKRWREGALIKTLISFYRPVIRSLSLLSLSLPSCFQNETFERLSSDVEKYFVNFTNFLQQTVVEGSKVLINRIDDFIERPNIPDHSNCTKSDCRFLLVDIEKFIEYLDDIKTFQLVNLTDSFNRLQNYFAEQVEKCETVRYNKNRCVELIVREKPARILS
jgi:hypothetical protein